MTFFMNKKYNLLKIIFNYVIIDEYEEIIEKNTGLILYSSNAKNRKITYIFDIVTDLDVKKPNLEEYKLMENN